MTFLEKLSNSKTVAGIIISAILIFGVLFFINDTFFNWAFERHQNTLSWFIRPILLIPFCYFAFKKSLNGILISIFAILTSMFWFCIPEVVDPKITQFLEMEMSFLKSGFTIMNSLSIVVIIMYFVLLAKSFWYRSIKLGIFVVFAGMLGKIFWSVINSPESGYLIIPFAILGFVFLLLSIVYFGEDRKQKSTY